ncbi:MAG: glycosyl hydrolase family 28-related protein [Ferruginibacter sp.]
MKKTGLFFNINFLLTLCAVNINAQVIPPSRSTDWSLAGYHGTIPVYSITKNITDYGGSGNGATDNYPALQLAITSLGNQNGTIYFPAGTFVFNSPITLRSGLILKGEGATNTVLTFNLGGSNNLINITGTPSAGVVNITTSIFKGESSLTVDEPSLFHEKDYINIYQADAGLINDASASESIGQIVQVESIAGNTIRFSNNLRRSYLLTDTPKVRKLNMVTGVGIECLQIKRLDVTGPLKSNIYFSYAAKCWVTGVESDSCNFAHVRIAHSTNIEVTNSYLHGAFSYGATGEAYGISCEYSSGECLIENNIFRHLRHSMLLQSGANGNVFDYNYSIGPFKSESLPNDLAGDIVMHGNYPYLNLFEGNIAQNIFVDAAHGINGPYNTMFRNRAESYGLIVSAGGGDSTNIVGNEITATGLFKGNYSMQGNGNLEYGNNKNGIIIPTGSTTLPDRSYIYNNLPAFWNIASSWPSIGLPNTSNTGTIPAKERYISGSNPAYCKSVQLVIYTFTGSGNWSEASNWSDNIMPPATVSNGSEIIIDPPMGQQCILDISYTISQGAKLTVRQGKHLVVQGNLSIVQ